MSDKDIPIDVNPVLPEDVNSGKCGPAPPSYEEVMGQYETSVQMNQPELPSLAYIDIMPRMTKPGNLQINVMPEFQPFQEIVRGANAWLAQNPGLAVWKCETVERKVLKGQGHTRVRVDLDSMAYRESAWNCNCYVFGIRMWLTQRASDQKTTQEIGLVNISPPEKEVEYTSYHRAGFIGLRHYMTACRVHTLKTYEGLRKSIEEFNAKVKANPIPGSVLNVETATLKFAEGFSTKSAQEVAEMSSWHEMSGMIGRRRTQVLRMFYVKGAPTTPQLEMAEFLPTRIGQAGLGRPIRFADFSDAENQAAEWLRAQRGIRLLNIETREAKYNTFFDMGGQVNIDTDSTDDFDLPMFESHKLRFLRVFFTSAGAPVATSYENTSLTTRVFPPVRCKGEIGYETMMQTMARIDAWLKLTGLPIFGVETTQVLDEGPSSFKKSQYKLRGFVGKIWVTAIKIYFAPPPYISVPEYLVAAGSGGKSSTCNIL
ncbi:hypothetical protein ElyMa_004175200 [Elysia marginata]|uniref:Uncharacterized protein n=1 Tax=Elysia marginata TaxID=1093978 RepID=A0AAV4GIH1_9GAST|nr:hypothetical protein ElyMa_004175200 [Elysia marginata]